LVSQVVVRITSQRGGPTEEALRSHMPGGRLIHGDIRFTVMDEPADVVVVINYLKYDAVIRSRSGYVWNWHNEPIVRQPFGRGFDRVFTHQESRDPRTVKSPPILDWWLQKSWDELDSMEPPSKSKPASLIASTKKMIEGHRRRNEFVSLVEEALPEVSVFGEGRPKTLDDKWTGLSTFRYSIAIENSSKLDYWTEKISDCFLAYTVPFYFGARNIGDYFPRDSFIWLPLDNPERAVQIIRETINGDSWEARLPALAEARRLALHDYSLFGQITSRVRQERDTILAAPWESRRIHGRRTRPGGWIRGIGFWGNLQNQSQKIESRLSRTSDPK